MSIEFPPFPKIPRWEKTIWITEKIDGTNGLIYVTDDGDVLAGSRNRWLTPGKQTDNYGFAGWVKDHEDQLRDLGPGAHYGEWWGVSIGRGYGLYERRFSLFNVSKFRNAEDRPDCCHVVPVLYVGPPSPDPVDGALGRDPITEWKRLLQEYGSTAAPGYMNPEGIMVYHEAARQYFKVPFEREHKGR